MCIFLYVQLWVCVMVMRRSGVSWSIPIFNVGGMPQLWSGGGCVFGCCPGGEKLGGRNQCFWKVGGHIPPAIMVLGAHAHTCPTCQETQIKYLSFIKLNKSPTRPAMFPATFIKIQYCLIIYPQTLYYFRLLIPKFTSISHNPLQVIWKSLVIWFKCLL